MIKIGKNLDDLQILAQNHYEILISEPFMILEVLKVKLRDKTLKNFERALFREFKKYLKEIITSTPKELVEIEKIISPFYLAYISKKSFGLKGKKKTSAIKTANNAILSIFCYDDFTKKQNAKHAYDLTENLDVTVCPYCNRQYIFTLSTDSGKCRPTLDHFFDKGKQPYFALSFFNLIPSCSVCNSSLKNQKKFSLENNLHPFLDSMFDVLEFTIGIKATDFINGSKKDFDISLDPNKKCIDKTLIKKAQSNADIFKIKELYAGHKDLASEIIKKAYYYNKTRIDELYKFKTEKGTSLFKSKEEVIEFALGNYINEQKMGKRVLAKFTRDLAKDLGMIKSKI